IPTINNWGEDNNLPGFTHNSVPSVSQPIFTPGNEFHEETHKRKELDFAWETSFWNSSSPNVYETEINIRNEEGKEQKAMARKKRNQKKWFMLELDEVKLPIVTVLQKGSLRTVVLQVADSAPQQLNVLLQYYGFIPNLHVEPGKNNNGVIWMPDDSNHQPMLKSALVRRGKINERLRSLQDIVPGCYRNMGMAVMLDEIINYVQFLQNQIEFLSMKLTAASACYDFNSDSDDMETMQLIRPSNKGIVLKMSMLDFSPQFLSPDSMESPQRSSPQVRRQKPGAKTEHRHPENNTSIKGPRPA
ncbi:hypothetical protein Goklo_019220, partial [Gossypium klotzschianum]|nr:hypothetical protein [Gossypium klotzschianum]